MDVTATVPIRRESGTMKGESPYALHPSSIDNCLQVALMSIYSGMVNNVNTGYVPVKIKEVTIHVPKTETAVGKAFARTTLKGVRSAMCSVQLVADGHVLLDIDDMRAIAYDNAVPPKSQATIENPFWHSCWVPQNSPAEAQEVVVKVESTANKSELLIVCIRCTEVAQDVNELAD